MLLKDISDDYKVFFWRMVMLFFTINLFSTVIFIINNLLRCVIELLRCVIELLRCVIELLRQNGYVRDQPDILLLLFTLLSQVYLFFCSGNFSS